MNGDPSVHTIVNTTITCPHCDATTVYSLQPTVPRASPWVGTPSIPITVSYGPPGEAGVATMSIPVIVSLSPGWRLESDVPAMSWVEPDQ